MNTGLVYVCAGLGVPWTGCCIYAERAAGFVFPAALSYYRNDVLSHDCRLAVRTYGDDLDRNLEEVLHERDVVAELLRKLVFRTAVCEVCVPSLELCVDWLDVGVSVERPLV